MSSKVLGNHPVSSGSKAVEASDPEHTARKKAKSLPVQVSSRFILTVLNVTRVAPHLTIEPRASTLLFAFH